MEYGRLTRHNITIESTYNKKAIVRTGCGTFAFDNADEICEFIKQYIVAPDAIRRQCNSTTEEGPANAPAYIGQQPEYR